MKLYKKCWVLLKPFWISKQWLVSAILLFSILAMIFFLVEIQVWFNNWNSDFFNALSDLDAQRLEHLVLWFVMVLAILVIIQVNKTWLIKLLTIRWRKWLTEFYLNRWFKDKQYYYYAIEHKDKRMDNPDQRIAEDIRLLIEKFLSLILGFIQSFTMLITFIVVLWQSSGVLEFEFASKQWKIPGYLVYCVFIFVFINTFITHVIGRKIRRLNREKQRNEADFRTSLIHQQEYAQDIALYHSEDKHKAQLSGIFDTIKDNWHALMNKQRNLEYWQVLHQRFSSVIPLFLLIPVFIAGQMNIGGLMKARQAFMLVSNNLSWFIFKYDALAEFAAVVDRLYQFHCLIEKKRLQIVHDGYAVSVKDGSISTPEGHVLLKNIDFTLQKGQWLHLHGRSGLGKTTLLKTIMGIWPYAQGAFFTPKKSYILTQQPYIPDGTLRDVLNYPNENYCSDIEFEAALKHVHLDNFIPQLNQQNQWSKCLSSGEKQRIGLARVLLNQPDWLLIDEATSHLDEQLAVTLLKKLRQNYPQMGVLFVSHQQQVAQQLADSTYQLEADNKSPQNS